jgi:hypothetical protein
MNYAAIALGFILAMLGAGWYGKNIGYDMREAEYARDAAAQDAARAEALKAAAEAVAKIDVKQITIQGKVVERIRTETVYAECRHSPETFALIQEAYKP